MDKSECFYDGCGSITKQQMGVANQCTVKDFVGEQTDGCKFFSFLELEDRAALIVIGLSKLPGMEM